MNQTLNKVMLWSSRNATSIFKWVAVGGTITNTVVSARQGIKAHELLEKKRSVLNRELTKKETVKAVWKQYIPVVALNALTIGCIIGGDKTHLKRNAALSAAYTLSQTALTDFKNKTIERIGEKKTQQIADDIIKDKIEKDPVSNKEVYISGKGETLFYDTLSGRYFTQDIEAVRKAINELNRDLIDDMYISLNDFYYSVGLKGTELGSSLGWNVNTDGLIDISFVAQKAEDERPCLALVYTVSPRYNYGDLQ